MGPISRLKQLLHHAFCRTPERVVAEQPWWLQEEMLWPSQSSDGPVVQRIVDNRVMLLGLDELYRTAVKEHERTELLVCAQRVSTVLRQAIADVPVEGYYSEDSALSTYFRTMRALQAVSLDRASEVEAMPEFRRLLTVTSSPIFGSPIRVRLLPTGRDPLSAALEALDVAHWSVPLLTAEAAKAARATDDFSLVGLAARAEDSVALAALRESVVLYAELVLGRAPAMPRFEYLWQVDPALAAAAQRFVDTYNGLFGPELPPPTLRYARIFWDAFAEADIVGRCVRLGQTDPAGPYYHWAVYRESEGHLALHEFWHAQIFTTERYRRGDLRHESQASRRHTPEPPSASGLTTA
jgi:hypothetical protein